MTASEPRNDKCLKKLPPFYNERSRQPISSVNCKDSAKISGAQIISTTRKLKTCLPSLKTSFALELRSGVFLIGSGCNSTYVGQTFRHLATRVDELVYKLTCSGCNSTYVGQTVRLLATRINEHRKGDSPIEQHLLECKKEIGSTSELKSEIIDQTANSHTRRSYSD